MSDDAEINKAVTGMPKSTEPEAPAQLGNERVSLPEPAVVTQHVHHSSPWRWPVTFMVLGLIGLVAYWITISQTVSIFKGGRNKVSEVSEQVGKALDTFSSAHISQSFLTQLPSRISAGGNQLEVASFESTESFRSESSKRIAWDYLDLGTTVAEVRVPVTYRYHVQLEDTWKLDVKDSICVVTAPRIRPTQPPAIHTHRIEKFSSRGWLRFDSQDALDELMRIITPTVRMYAGDDQHVALIKDTARKSIARFVQKWLLDNNYWSTNMVNTIIVSFPDEITEDNLLLENPDE
ncbi:MAG: hypothetical protein LR011_02355 [Verrucomicrobia bacterium]|nr:hypothetical protein [Verrucomicrobiota bacterium]